MNTQTALQQARRIPVTITVAVLAALVSIALMSGVDVAFFTANVQNVRTQPWTFITTVLPHISVVVLAVNLVFWWVLARRIELAWGSASLLGITLLLAVTGSAAELSFGHANIGLSGIVFGLFVLLLVVQGRDDRLAKSVSPAVATVLVLWLFAGFATTITQIMPVATFAQAAGALVGAALGMCVISHNARRGAWATALVLVALATGVGPALGRPVLDVANRFRNYPHEGEIALENGKYDTAIELLNTAVQEDPKNTQALLDLATAELKYGNEDEAIDAFKRVVTLDASKRSELAPKIAELLGGKAFQAISARKAADARAAAEEALKWDPNNGQALHVTGLLLNAAGKFDEAIATLRKAKEHTSETEYSDASFTFDMGLLAARTGHLPEAEQRFRESLKANDSPLTWFYLAQCLEQNRSSAEAINAYEEAAKFFELTKPAKDAEIKLLLGAGN